MANFHLRNTEIFSICPFKNGICDRTAEELALLMEEAIVTAQVSQKPDAAKIAKRAAAVLIEH
jgi:hypothetical protein